MGDIIKLVRIQLFVIVIFIIFKLARPTVLASNSHALIKKFFLSFPNLCEGVIGVLLLTGLGLYLNKFFKLKVAHIYFSAIVLASIYVVTQETKIHNLGGDNIYDINDLLFSIIGFTIGSIIVYILKPKRKR